MTLAAPAPQLGPDDVVGAQLAALRLEPQEGSGAGGGIRTAWAFASPGNQAATGPVDRFADLLRTPLYVGLLEHRAAQLGPVRHAGDAVHLEVLVLTKDDRTQGYTWVLGRQGGPPHPGCWLTDGVLRHPDPEAPA